MDSFPMSVANNLCDKLLPKYLDSKTVLIYCPHPVHIRETVYFDGCKASGHCNKSFQRNFTKEQCSLFKIYNYNLCV